MPDVSQHAFAEKVALITGGNTAIGRAVAMQLGLFGAYVLVAHPIAGGAVPIIEELKSLGTLAAGIPFSEYGRAGATEIANEVDKRFQRLDLLVNCTELKSFCDFEETTSGHFLNSTEILLESAFFNTQECIVLMAERPSPRIVNIFSGNGPAISTDDVIAKTLNASIGAFTKALAGYLPAKYRVNAVCVSQRGPEQAPNVELDTDLFRAPTDVNPDIVARTVLFLLSSEAKGLNGEILNVG